VAQKSPLAGFLLPGNFSAMVDRFESSLDLLWYRADNNQYPADGAFDEHRDPVDALAEQAVNQETGSNPRGREMDQTRKLKVS
jgi:hypothetical protein